MAAPKRYRAIAEYYDFENARHPILDRDVPFFLRQVPRGRRVDVLELAAGTGRAAIPIAQAGHRVVGVDYAADMLAIARRKRDAVGLPDRDLEIIQGDILGLDLGRRFDWVCVFFNTLLAFTTLAEQDEALRAVTRHLRPGGRLWLDVFNPDPSMLARTALTDLDPYAFYVPALDRTVFMATDVRRTKRPQVQRVTFRYAWFDAHGRERRRRVEFDMTYLFPREAQLLLERHGLRVERMFGDYDGSEVTSASPRIIARAAMGK